MREGDGGQSQEANTANNPKREVSGLDLIRLRHGPRHTAHAAYQMDERTDGHSGTENLPGVLGR